MDWKTVVEELPAAVVIVNWKGEVVYVNKILLERSGLSFEEATKNPQKYFIPEDYPKLSERVLKTFLERIKNPDPAPIIRSLSADGRRFWLEVRTRFAEIDGKPYCLITYTDVSERVRLQWRIEELNEHLRFLNSMLRHDILNLFTRIYPLIEMLEEEFNPEILKKVKIAVESGIELVRKMKELESAVEVELRSYRLKEVIGEVASGYGIKAVVEGDAAVMANEGIYNVFGNLIANAIKHGRATEVRAVISSDGEIEVLFEDNGVGIPSEIADRLFMNRTTTSGSGLGLFIVKKLMESYGGSIELIEPQKARFLLKFRKALDMDGYKEKSQVLETSS